MQFVIALGYTESSIFTFTALQMRLLNMHECIGAELRLHRKNVIASHFQLQQ